MEKIVVLVDVQNIYYTTKQSYDCNFDYNKFW
ncbi:MAG: nuclease, partial [Gammaproteobacteria bacterium]